MMVLQRMKEAVLTYFPDELCMLVAFSAFCLACGNYPVRRPAYYDI
jgi:hypothetical protein